jgi:hypothetical protein
VDSGTPAELTTEVTPVRPGRGGRVFVIAGPLVLGAVVALAVFGGRLPQDTASGRTAAAAVPAKPAPSDVVASSPTSRTVYIPWPAIPHRSPAIEAGGGGGSQVSGRIILGRAGPLVR